MSINLDTNPLRAGLIREKAIDPCIFVIFGGTGDLAHRKLMPALYHLYIEGMLPRSFAIVGYASQKMTTDEYRQSMRETIQKCDTCIPSSGGKVQDDFFNNLYYVGRIDDTLQSLKGLKTELEKVDTSIGVGGNYLYYLAIPPSVVEDTIKGIGEVGLAKDPTGKGWRRVVIEKPFGTDLESARNLNRAILSVFKEDQIYRIDHYLGKETVQNILVFRFANRFVEPLLNSRYVDHIQISVAETIGVEKRGKFYDSTGALRDIVQNHILQVLSLICMDPPSSLDAEPVRDEKLKVFRSISRIDPVEVSKYAARAQYSSGMLMGEMVPGYREEDQVAKDSKTETYVALKLTIDNWRWAGVPVYIRTGKRLAKRATEVAIQLKEVPPVLFGKTHKNEMQPNVIALKIQPDEGISIRFEAKAPGLNYCIQPVRMDFRYGSAFGASVPEAYERLLLDSMLGDPSLYARGDGVEACWEVIDPILRGWQEAEPPVYSYVPGSWGPREATDLIEKDGRKWRRL